MAGPIWWLSVLLAVLLGVALAAGAAAYVAYRRDVTRIRSRLAVGSHIYATAAGPIECADTGQGPPVLVIHGAAGGYDQGLLIAQMNFGANVRVIAPSRFGYLRTPFPPDASPAAQADAHAALLDALGIDEVVVLGFSAGGRSAIQLALRHKEKVRALIIESLVMAAPFRIPDLNRVGIGRMLLQLAKAVVDFPYWLAIHIAPSLMVRFSGRRRNSMPRHRNPSALSSWPSCMACCRCRPG
ncbi:MAG: alpha/beta fold hydrolase [Methylovirgula sp.]